jgi:hypothetical protein
MAADRSLATLALVIVYALIERAWQAISTIVLQRLQQVNEARERSVGDTSDGESSSRTAVDVERTERRSKAGVSAGVSDVLLLNSREVRCHH